MVSSSLWTWICPPSLLCWLQHTHKMGYWALPARPPHSLDLGWLSELPSPLLIHVQAYCTTSYQFWKRTAVSSLQWILRRFTGLLSFSPSVRQSTFQNAERPVVDFPLVDCQSTELQDIGYSQSQEPSTCASPPDPRTDVYWKCWRLILFHHGFFFFFFLPSNNNKLWRWNLTSECIGVFMV